MSFYVRRSSKIVATLPVPAQANVETLPAFAPAAAAAAHGEASTTMTPHTYAVCDVAHGLTHRGGSRIRV